MSVLRPSAITAFGIALLGAAFSTGAKADD